jgi:hypothetical protein
MPDDLRSDHVKPDRIVPTFVFRLRRFSVLLKAQCVTSAVRSVPAAFRESGRSRFFNVALMKAIVRHSSLTSS